MWIVLSKRLNTHGFWLKTSMWEYIAQLVVFSQLDPDLESTVSAGPIRTEQNPSRDPYEHVGSPLTSSGSSPSPLSSVQVTPPDVRMHLSLDTMSMVDDSCLSPSNFHEMGKGGGAAVGGRVHSIDVILGFNKDQDPLLSPAGPMGPQKMGIDGLGDHVKQQESLSHPSYSGHLRNSSSQQQQQYQGEWKQMNTFFRFKPVWINCFGPKACLYISSHFYLFIYCKHSLGVFFISILKLAWCED